MQSDPKGTKVFRILCALLLLVCAGCTAARKPVVPVTGPTCPEVLSGSLTHYSDDALTALLDNASAGNRQDDCWAPLVKECLKENRAIPHHHLVKAVHAFNRNGEMEAFHMAVYRYMMDLSENEATYGPEDRRLLETWCRHLIHQAESKNDVRLNQARLVCRKLDHDLYSRLFN